MEKGYRVLFSVYHNDIYDFAVDDGRTFTRVNVKCVSPEGPGRYKVSSAGAGQRNKHQVGPDMYLVWLVDQARFVELPGDFLEGRKTRRITRQFLSGDA